MKRQKRARSKCFACCTIPWTRFAMSVQPPTTVHRSSGLRPRCRGQRDRQCPPLAPDCHAVPQRLNPPLSAEEMPGDHEVCESGGPEFESFRDQGRQSQNYPRSNRGPARSPRSGKKTRRLRLIDPAPSKLCPAAEDLRRPCHKGRTLKHAWASPCLCTGPV